VALQGDTLSIEAQRLVPFVLKAAEDEPDLAASLDLAEPLARLRSWDFTMPSGVAAEYRTDGGPDADEIEASIGAAIFAVFRANFYVDALGDEQAEYGVNFPHTEAVLYLLENHDTKTGVSVFDNMTTPEVETLDGVVLGALGKARDYLVSKLGESPDGWRWGAIHQVEVRDMFGDFVTSFRTFGPYPRGGGKSTVDVAGTGSETEDFTFIGGPQMRFVAEVGKGGIVAENSLPGGQIDDPDSAHYGDLLPMWLRNETFPYYFEPDDVAAHAEDYFVIAPPVADD
jgi:acyl-homoserine lactone acylase PvdQ